MKKNYTIIILFTFLLLKQEAYSKSYFYYGYARPNDTLSKIFHLSANDEAKQKLVFLDFQFIGQDGKPVKNVKYLLNDHPVNENFIRIETGKIESNKDQSFKISVIFNEECEQGTFKGYFKIINSTPGVEYLDKSNSIVSCSSISVPIKWKFNIPWTLTDYLIKIVLPLFFILILLWFALLRNIIYSKFTSGYLEFIDPAKPRINLKGLRRVHLGGLKQKSQNKLEKLFTGEILILWPDLLINVEFYPYKTGGKVFCRYVNDPETNIDPFIDQLCDHDELTISNILLESKYKISYLNSRHPRIN